MGDLEIFQEPARSKEVIQAFVDKAKEAESRIPDILKNGADFTPYDDMVLYMIIAKPKLTEEEMEGIDTNVLDILFEGDKEGDLTEQKLVIISKGDGCKKDINPGDRVAVRGHAFKITTPKGTFFTVREYDVIGKYE